jgi:hypothetical protein
MEVHKMDKSQESLITFLDAMLYAQEGKSPSLAIENMEKRGQESVVRGVRLPKKVNDGKVPLDIRDKGINDTMDFSQRFEIYTLNNIEYTKGLYEKMGIVILEAYDDLFWNVQLPEGWEIKATDHTMWNELLDNKGRRRASFFYKASFYDRDAFINFGTRFQVGVDHIADPNEEYNIWKKSELQGTVKDGNEVIFCTECRKPSEDWKEDDIIRKELKYELEIFMNEHYPDYQNIFAYWD